MIWTSVPWTQIRQTVAIIVCTVSVHIYPHPLDYYVLEAASNLQTHSTLRCAPHVDHSEVHVEHIHDSRGHVSPLPSPPNRRHGPPGLRFGGGLCLCLPVLSSRSLSLSLAAPLCLRPPPPVPWPSTRAPARRVRVCGGQNRHLPEWLTKR